jgi:DNA-binding HxlR family transcriptional regulator
MPFLYSSGETCRLQVTIHHRPEYDRPVTDHTHTHEQSPLEAAVARVGDRWTLLVVEALLEEPLRFNELTERVRGIAPNILTSRLRGLERDGLVLAHPYSSRPPRFVYELTDSGRELAGALRLLAEWGARRSEHSEALRHEACGTALEARWYCPTCERTLEDGEVTDVEYV